MSFTQQGDARNTSADVFPVPGVTDGVGFGQPALDQYGNTYTEVLGDVRNIAIDIFNYVPKTLDNPAAALVLQQQNALLRSGS